MSGDTAAAGLSDVELHERLLVEAVVAAASLNPAALTRGTSRRRVTIDQDAVAHLVATVDQLAPGVVDRVRRKSGKPRLRRPQ